MGKILLKLSSGFRSFVAAFGREKQQLVVAFAGFKIKKRCNYTLEEIEKFLNFIIYNNRKVMLEEIAEMLKTLKGSHYFVWQFWRGKFVFGMVTYHRVYSQ